MVKKYTQEQISQAIDNLSEELREALFSTETAEAVSQACQRYEAADEKSLQISDMVLLVLTGLLLPSEFQEALEKEVGLPEETARSVTDDINRFVFYPVRGALEEIHKPKSAKPDEKPPAEKPEAKEEKAEQQEKRPPGKDVYRESIE